MKPGDVILVKFPFADIEKSKKRPALILKTFHIGQRNQNVVLAMITSQIEGLRHEGDYILKDWKQANLLHESKVRFSKLATIDMSLIDQKLGDLSKSDLAECKNTMQKSYQFWLK